MECSNVLRWLTMNCGSRSSLQIESDLLSRQRRVGTAVGNRSSGSQLFFPIHLETFDEWTDMSLGQWMNRRSQTVRLLITTVPVLTES
jgi:hypothetical protein